MRVLSAVSARSLRLECDSGRTTAYNAMSRDGFGGCEIRPEARGGIDQPGGAGQALDGIEAQPPRRRTEDGTDNYDEESGSSSSATATDRLADPTNATATNHQPQNRKQIAFPSANESPTSRLQNPSFSKPHAPSSTFQPRSPSPHITTASLVFRAHLSCATDFSR